MTSIFKRAVGWFKKRSRKEDIKKVTTTLTDSKRDEVLNVSLTDTQAIIDKMKRKENMTLQEISILMSDLFDQKAIQTTTHKFREVFVRDCLFVIEEVRLVSSSETSPPRDMVFRLKETVYGIEMEITVTASNFHEIFQSLDLTNLNKAETKNDS